MFVNKCNCELYHVSQASENPEATEQNCDWAGDQHVALT